MPSATEILWSEVIEDKKAKLSKKDWAQMSMIDSPNSIGKNLATLQDEHQKRRSTRFLDSLSPIFERLEAFTKALNVYVQADSTGIASLVCLT